jgi:hypothetical protein
MENNVDRFKLEEQIQNCWQVVDDLKTIYSSEKLYEDENEMQNALLGMFTLYQLKFEELFATYEKLVQEGNIK